MSRPHSEDNGAIGNESFLDVVTNLVGILIILVMIVGMRLKNAPVELPPSQEMAATATAFEKEQGTEQSLLREIKETQRRIRLVEREADLRGEERDVYATMVSALEYTIRSGRDRLDAGAKEDFDRGRELAEFRTKLEQLEGQRAQAETSEKPPVVVENYPTPIGKVVVADEVHFQMRAGRIAFIPIDRLVEMTKSDARHKADQLLGRSAVPEFTETIGPEGGFRFRYTVQRHDEVAKTPNGPVRRVGLQLAKWTVIPVDSQLGETVEEALGPNSQFRRAIAGLRTGDSTVTIWVYEDSFASFREIRKELHRLGFPVAARPLPEGVLIAGSPRGSRSEAE